MSISAVDSLDQVLLQKISYSKQKITNFDINNQLDSIHQQLNKYGYLNFDYTKKENDSLVTVTYKLHQKTDSIYIHTTDNILLQNYITQRALTLTNTVLQIPYNRIDFLLNDILDFYNNKGYAFTKVHLSHINVVGNHLIAAISIRKNRPRTIDGIVIQGYDKFPKKFIKRYFNTKNTLFNTVHLKRISDKTKALSFTSEIKKPQVLFLKDSTLIYVYLKNKKINQFDGTLGLSTTKDNTPTLKGYLNLALNNVFHKGEQLSLQWQSIQNQSKQLKIEANIPYLFNSPISPHYKFSIFSQDSSYINIDSKLSLNYALNYKNTIGAIITSRTSNTLLKTDGLDNQDYSTFFYGINYEYKKASTAVFNPNGFLVNIKLLTGQLQTDTNTSRQNKIRFKTSYLYSINQKNKLFLKNTSFILSTNTYLNNALEQIGGQNDLRGFQENSLQASSYSVFNIEYHLLLNKTTLLYSITDYGYLKNDLTAKANSLFGVGFGYKTKLNTSILDLNYTIGNTNKAFLLNNATLNIRIITVF